MKNSGTFFDMLKRFFLIGVFILGLMTIVGTSDDDNDDSSDDTNTTDSTTSGTNTAPVASISVPAEAATFNEGSKITFTGAGTDTEDGTLSGAALYWGSSIDGRLGIGSILRDVDLSTGTHAITITATDTAGAAHAVSIALTINPIGNTLPTVSITSPSGGDTFSVGEYITFTGTGTDTEDGDLTGNSLTWTSNKNKMIGIGTSFETDMLASGEHIVTLTATDDANTKTSTNITITIKNTLPTATITWPADGDEFSIGDTIICNGTGYDAEDGNLGGASLEWRVNGTKVGNGGSASFDYLTTAGDYVVALHATDSAGETDVNSIEITLN